MTTSIPAPPQILSREHIENPWPGLAILRDHYPVHRDESLGVCLISRYDDIRSLSVVPGGAHSQEIFGKYLADATAFFAMDGPEHRRRRSLLAPVFAKAGIDAIGDLVEKNARMLLEPVFERERAAIEAGERTRAEMDFVTEFTGMYPVNVLIQILDLPMTKASDVHEWLSAWIDCSGNISNDPTVIERGVRAREGFGALVRPLIAERRTGEGDDLITRLCHAEIDGRPLTDDEIQSIAATMFAAGGETTDHQLAWVMHELIVQPGLQQEIIDDQSLVSNLLGESLRYHSIIPFGHLLVPEGGVEVDGINLPEGTLLTVMWDAGNRDPRRFENPEAFDIHRTDLDMRKAFSGAAEHLGFGQGAHFCTGSHLAKAEMQTALNVFFEHARDVRFADGFEPELSRESPFARALANLKISFELV